MAIKFGACSWNYDSWVGLVYSEPRKRAADYLEEYAKVYDSVEVDSWFYKLPTRREAEEYAAVVPGDFTFTCKAPRDISLTHFRSDQESKNPAFLSVALYRQFLENLEPIAGQLGAVILEFEYCQRRFKFAGFSRREIAGFPSIMISRNQRFRSVAVLSFDMNQPSS